MSRLAHQIAVESEHVAADVVEIESLPEIAERHRVTAVPKVLINDVIELFGSQSEESLLDAIGAPE